MIFAKGYWIQTNSREYVSNEKACDRGNTVLGLLLGCDDNDDDDTTNWLRFCPPIGRIVAGQDRFEPLGFDTKKRA